jgi:hypothetical protein
MSLWETIQSLLLSANAVLIWRYVRQTIKLREAAQQQVKVSQRQVEASHRPALVAQHQTTDEVVFVNIGSGPAINVRWSVPDSDWKGNIPYLEPGCNPRPLPIREWEKVIINAALKGHQDRGRIECDYRSLSGWRYRSICLYELERTSFSIQFEDNGPAGF